MARRKVTFDVQVNTPSAQREADRLANIFKSRLSNIAVGTRAGGAGGAGGGGGGGRGGATSGMPGSSMNNLIAGSFQFALAGHFYQFFSKLPQMIPELDNLATANKRATASFETLAGGAQEANEMITAFQQGSGNTADKMTATTESMRLFNIGMATSADQMRAFVTLSRGMSQALGKPVEYIQEQFSLAIANQSELRFDQLGLSLVRHKELMREAMEADSEMTNEMAFRNAMITQATEKFFSLALAEEALATSTEIATRNFKDFWNTLAEGASANVIAPITELLASMTGAGDYNLGNAGMQLSVNQERNTARRFAEGPDTGSRLWAGAFSNDGDAIASKEAQAASRLHEQRAQLGESIIELGNTMQAAANMGMEIDPQWVTTLEDAKEKFNNLGEEVGGMGGRVEATSMIIRDSSNDVDGLTESLLGMSSAAQIADGQIATINDRLLGAQVAMVGKMIEAGVDLETVKAMSSSEADIFDMAKKMQAEGGLSGDAVQDAINLAQQEKDLLGEEQDLLDDRAEAEAAGKRAASALEQAAEKAEKAFLNAADSIVDAYSKMLHQIPGLFGASEVTEEDLKLAEMGFSVNYVDDALRRLEDVAYNKKDRDDVDLSLWERALGMPGGTDPRALAIYGRRAQESGALAANPELMKQLYNVDALKAGMADQEKAALGTRNLETWLGLPTDGGNEFLKVFGMEAMNPLQDGLISEITTRGPIMGGVLADSMFEGFKSQALTLPWVQSLMNVMESEVGRRIMTQLNTNVTSDMAESEAVP